MSILTNKNKKGNAIQIELSEGVISKIVVQSEVENLEYVCDIASEIMKSAASEIISAIGNKKYRDVDDDDLYS